MTKTSKHLLHIHKFRIIEPFEDPSQDQISRSAADLPNATETGSLRQSFFTDYSEQMQPQLATEPDFEDNKQEFNFEKRVQTYGNFIAIIFIDFMNIEEQDEVKIDTILDYEGTKQDSVEADIDMIENKGKDIKIQDDEVDIVKQENNEADIVKQENKQVDVATQENDEVDIAKQENNDANIIKQEDNASDIAAQVDSETNLVVQESNKVDIVMQEDKKVDNVAQESNEADIVKQENNDTNIITQENNEVDAEKQQNIEANIQTKESNETKIDKQGSMEPEIDTQENKKLEMETQENDEVDIKTKENIEASIEIQENTEAEAKTEENELQGKKFKEYFLESQEDQPISPTNKIDESKSVDYQFMSSKKTKANIESDTLSKEESKSPDQSESKINKSYTYHRITFRSLFFHAFKRTFKLWV